ncbi:hypothetical protein H5410_011502 [Solanum commersonii]|uniref:MADS-box domain-containing protein n=1 Tax=Solanum commersonii TaxID=4109 RepID=A0A9J6APJ6_SOLCO|nr:hypothetical protein H5410_011502 [Solanum commersonii]
MGTGKKKIEIEKITKNLARMATFSKRKKGLFRKAEELESLTSSRITSVVFSPSGIPYTYGDVNSVIKKHFSSCNRSKISTLVNSHHSSYDVLVNIRGQNHHRPQRGMVSVEQLEGTRKKIVANDSESFEALFM